MWLGTKWKENYCYDHVSCQYISVQLDIYNRYMIIYYKKLIIITHLILSLFTLKKKQVYCANRGLWIEKGKDLHGSFFLRLKKQSHPITAIISLSLSPSVLIWLLHNPSPIPPVWVIYSWPLSLYHQQPPSPRTHARMHTFTALGWKHIVPEHKLLSLVGVRMQFRM